MCAGNAGCGCGNCTGINIGKTGATGATGAAGATGADGADGADGTNGTNGTNGTDGVTVITSQVYNEFVAMNQVGGADEIFVVTASGTPINAQIPLVKFLQTNEDEIKFEWTLLQTTAEVVWGERSGFRAFLNNGSSLSGAVTDISALAVTMGATRQTVNAIGRLSRVSANTFRFSITYSVATFVPFGGFNFTANGWTANCFSPTTLTYTTTFTYNASTNIYAYIIPTVDTPRAFTWSLMNFSAWGAKKYV